MHPIFLPALLINAAVFAVLFPLLMRAFTRKWIGWFETLVAVVVYVAVGAALQYTDILHRIHLLGS